MDSTDTAVPTVRHCPNRQCPGRRGSRVPEFRGDVESCPRCGEGLELGPADDEHPEFVEMTELASFTYVHEAELAASHLQAAGIETRIADRNTLGMHALLSVAMGGVRLFVPAEDVEAAREVLSQDERVVDVPGVGPYRGGATRGAETCSHCGSTDIEHPPPRRTAWWGVLSVLLLGIPLLFVRHSRCRNCGKQWRAPSAGPSGR